MNNTCLQRDFRAKPLLDALAITSPVAGRLRARLINEARTLTIAGGSSVFRAGDPCPAFLAVASGEVRVAKTSPAGRKVRLYHVRPGAFCALTASCVLGGLPYPADGVAESEVVAVRVPKDLFETLLVEVHSFRAAIFGAVSTQFTGLVHLVEEVAFLPLERRLAALLLREAVDGVDLRDKTHQALAEELGCSREIVSRILESLQDRGVVTLGRKRIQLLDRAALAALARSR